MRTRCPSANCTPGTIRVGFLFAIVLGAVVLAWPPFLPAQNPSFARVPAVAEYDVEPAWPQRPEDVKPWGWVSGMAVDSQDNIWLFNKGEDPVQVFTAAGQFVRTWGKGSFVDPHHLRIDPEGNVWVADFGLHVVQKYTPEGKLLLTLGEKGVQGEDNTHFNRPTDMVVTPAGDIFVTDGYGNRRVVHFDKSGQFVKTWGSYGSGPGEFVLPHAIAMDSKGVLYVCDRNSGRIQLFNQQGEFLDQWSNVIMPWGIHISADDGIWVCGSSPHWWYRGGEYQEYKDQVIMRFTTDGRVTRVWALPLGEPMKTTPGQTVGVHCIVQDSTGNVYVGDIYGERAQKFVPVVQRDE